LRHPSSVIVQLPASAFFTEEGKKGSETSLPFFISSVEKRKPGAQ
jgi:hypothetical protein